MRSVDVLFALINIISYVSPPWKHIKLIISVVLCILFSPFIGDAFDDDIEKDLQHRLEQSRMIIIAIQNKLSAGSSPSSDITRLKSSTENIRINNVLLEERFELRKDKLKSLGSTVITRHQTMTEGYRKALTEYLSLIDSLPPDADVKLATQATQQLISLLNRILPKKKRPVIGSLPYKHLNYPAQQPITSQSITPAYRGGNKTVSPDDTKNTLEAPISTAIAGLAQSLNWNPVSIYEYVKNSIDTEWYWGCMKGAEETLRQKSGNDCDQATLLTALLRASGFPTRYVRGTVQFFPDIEQAMNLTGIDDPAGVAELFRKSGIPHNPLIAGGKIANIQIEHIWVESQIPYANYRGVVIDANGKKWLGLDTSIKVKGYTYNNPPDILSTMSLSTIRDEYLGILSASTVSTPFELNQTPLEYLQSAINSELQTLNSQLTYTDHLRTKTLIPEVLNILPASMQFTLVQATKEYTTVPDELIHTVKCTATNNSGSELFSITLPVYQLSNQQVAITYEPETVQDQEVVDSFGGLDNTPAYLVRLRPVLKIWGEREIAAREGLPTGADYSLSLDVMSPNGIERLNSKLTVGNLVVLGVTAQKAVIYQQQDPNAQKDAERLLYEEAMHYAERWGEAEEELASLLQTPIARPMPNIELVGGVIDVTYLLDVPHGFTWKGIYVDASLRALEAVTGTQSTDDRRKTFMQLSSLQGSILESRIFEDDLQVQAISTAKLFQIMNQGSGGGSEGSELLTIDKTNADVIVPALVFDQNIKDDITNALNQNLVIRIPRVEMTYSDWTGIGYIKENAETGESGWMLSGMIAGGMTAWDINKWNAVIAGTLSFPYSEPPNYDPSSAQYIEKITVTDMQNGTAGAKLKMPLQARVTDGKHKPVPNSRVTFTIKAGGGTFANAATSVTVTTNAIGIASSNPTLGKYTNVNPTFVWDTSYTYSQQAGENIIDASLPSGTSLTVPFTVLGLPDMASLGIKPLYGDGTYGSVLSLAGFVSVSVEDQYENPVSNAAVTFTSAQINPSCSADQTKNYASLVSAGADCLKQSPVWGDCGNPKSSLTVTTSSNGAAVEIILGSVPNAIYPITATSKALSATFNLHTFDFGNCSGSKDPENKLMITSVELNDQYGNTINAGKTGSTIPVQAKLYYLREGENINYYEQGSCSPPYPCKKIIGDTTYSIDTSPASCSVTFANHTSVSQGGGVYKADYTLQPGKNIVSVQATAGIIINKSQNSCSGCYTDPIYNLTNTGTATMTVYGVAVNTQLVPMLIVDENGYLSSSQTITYTIEPLSSDYKAMTAFIMIYKNGSIVAQIPTEKQGTGYAVLGRGFQFDANSTYEAEVILNYGTGVEIKGTRVNLPIAQLKVLTDASPASNADEIKFSDGSNKSTNSKKYHMEMTSKSFLSSCATLTGRIVTLSTATATTGQPVTTPQNIGGTYASEYPLAFKHPILPIGNNLCNVQIVDTLDSGSQKDKFILANRPRNELESLNISNTAVLYGGIGNKFWAEVAGVGKELPIEPVGVVILAIDGMRQDVLYAPQNSNSNDVKASYSDTIGCGGQSCYTDLSTIKGFCTVLGGKYSEILGISSCDPTSAENRHIKLPDVTTIFPSITFAAWASIYSGKLPNETGILGNEFFARDLYNPKLSFNTKPGLDSLPSGMVTLDADGGAMRTNPSGPKSKLSAAMQKQNPSALFALGYVMPAEFLGFTTMTQKRSMSAPGSVLMTTPVWQTINEKTAARYQVDNTKRCDSSNSECRTVSIFNQYVDGVDWWSTPSFKWKTLWESLTGGPVFDTASSSEAVDFVNNYFMQLALNGKRKKFPALFSVYLPGLDHDAHMTGMGNYTKFVRDTLDHKIVDIVEALRDKDEFDNKIFIIVSDHGHTAMPTDLSYVGTIEDISLDGMATLPSTTAYLPVDMPCNLQTDMQNDDIRKSEVNNNNLHIWELAEVMKQAGIYKGTEGLVFAVVAPQKIASLYDKYYVGAKSSTATANVIAALNGPMAHIYLKNRVTNSWNSPRLVEDIGYIAELLRLVMSANKAPSNLQNIFPAGLFEQDVPILASTDRLSNSIDYILVRRNTSYEVFYGIKPDGSDILSAPLSNYAEISSSLYVDAIKRIAAMNHPDRSGDIVLIMRDFTTDDASSRFTTAYACKSWHGSLNPSDSYVPFILSYPGGNKSEVDKILQNVSVCANGQCEGNWSMTDIIKEITNRQYGSQ